MQCKDIPEQPIIDMLTQDPRWHTWFRTEPQHMPCILDAFPKETPTKLALAKLKKMISQGKIDGCICGCRGDFTLN